MQRELVERLARAEANLAAQIAYTRQLERERDAANRHIRAMEAELRTPGTGRHRRPVA